MIFVVPAPPRSKYFWIKILLALIASFSFAIVLVEEKIWTWWQQQHTCANSTYLNQAPVFYRQDIQTESYSVCGQNLMLSYSGLSKTPLWIAEYFSAQPQNLNPKIERPKLAVHHRAHLQDQQIEQYHYKNIQPLHAYNQSLDVVSKAPFQSEQHWQQWNSIHQTLRDLSQSDHQDIYVITGTDYQNQDLSKIANQIWQPKGFYKAVYIPETGVMGAYYLSNDAQQNNKIKFLSICALEEKLAMQLFPQLNSEQKRDVYQLPVEQRTEFNWQYAYWDSQSQCDAAYLQAQANQTLEQHVFVATPWLERMQTRLLSYLFAILHWLVAQV